MTAPLITVRAEERVSATGTVSIVRRDTLVAGVRAVWFRTEGGGGGGGKRANPKTPVLVTVTKVKDRVRVTPLAGQFCDPRDRWVDRVGVMSIADATRALAAEVENTAFACGEWDRDESDDDYDDVAEASTQAVNRLVAFVSFVVRTTAIATPTEV